MLYFDLQCFDDTTDENTDVDTAQDTAAETQADEQEAIPEELGGLPEEYAREILAQAKAQSEPAQEEPQSPKTEDYVPYARFKEKIDEVNSLKEQLAAYQRQQSQSQPQQAPQPAPQTQQTPPPQQHKKAEQFKPPSLVITPEISKQLSDAVLAEAKALSGFSDDDVASLVYADDDDTRLTQWAQAKSIAKNRVYGALQQMEIQRQQQFKNLHDTQMAAVTEYNEFVTKEFAEPDFNEIKQFATNDFFEQLSPAEQRIVAGSYYKVEQQTASPAEMLVVKKYYERAKAAYRTRGAKQRSTQQDKATAPQQAVRLPRADQLKGTSTTNSERLSTSDIEKLLQGDFTKIDDKTQRFLLGMS